MKEIRKINSVVTLNLVNRTDGTDSQFKHSISDSMPEHYPQSIHPNNISQVFYLLKNFEINKPERICTDTMVSESNTHEKLECSYELKYGNSMGGRSTMSAFSVCSLNNVLQILFEWCKGNDAESIANLLGINNPIVSGLCLRAADVVDKFIRSNIRDWQIGGPGVVVVIDTYPEGCANSRHLRMSRPILCILEVKSIPQKYWLETLEDFDRSNSDQMESIKQHILATVRSVVLPGSILITPFTSTLCHYNDFKCLTPMYPTIVSANDLARHDNDQQTVHSNLATIWKSILDICEEAQFYNSRYVRQFIVSHMWRRRYGERSFEVLLNQLSLRQ